MSKYYQKNGIVFITGMAAFFLSLLLMLYFNKNYCKVCSPNSPDVTEGHITLCSLKFAEPSFDFRMNAPEDFSLYIPDDRGCTLTVNGVPFTSDNAQEYLVCPLSGFSPENTPTAFHVELDNDYSYDPYFGTSVLYLGTTSRINSLVQGGSFQRFFVIGVSFTILLYSLSLYGGKPTEKYLLLLALLAYSTTARTLWNARPILKHIPLANFLLLGTIDFPGIAYPMDYHLSFLLLKALIAWLRCRLLGEFVSVKLGKYSYFSLCIPVLFAMLPFCFMRRGYYVIQLWLLLIHVLELFVMVRGAKNHFHTCITLAAAWGLTLAFRLYDIACTAGIISHGFIESSLKPQGIIETFYIIAFVAVINLKFAHRYQEADQLSLSLEAVNTNLEQMVDIRTQELTQAYSRLNEMQQQKSEFLANTIHNLKTPLFSLYGYTDMVLDELEAEPELARKHLLEINKNTDYARHLIDNLFLCIRLEDGKVQYNPMPFPVSLLLEQLGSTSAPKAAAAGIQLMVQPFEEDLTLHADLLYLRQALQNIIDNAIRHSPANSTIRVQADSVPNCTLFQIPAGPVPAHTSDLSSISGCDAAEPIRETPCICFTIQDHGEGIAPDELPLIFSRYYSGGKRNTSSSGLGLTITKGIVEQHGGRIEVESKLGKGTTFRVYLPLTSGQPAVQNMEL